MKVLSRPHGHRLGAIVAVAMLMIWLSSVHAQSPASSPNPAAAPAATKDSALEERLRKLEAMNQRLLQQYEAMEKLHNERYKKLAGEFETLKESIKERPEGGVDQGDGSGDGVVPAQNLSISGDGSQRLSGPEGTIGRDTLGFSSPETSEGGAGPSGLDGFNNERFGSGRFGGPQGTISRSREGDSRPGKFMIGRGLRFTSDDDEFQLIFHDLTQAEIRGFPNAGDQSPLKTQFFVPRQRWYFTGRATKDVEYYTVINRGYGSLDLLDAFLDFKYLGPKIILRVGRTKSPVSYEYYQIAEGDLIAPERSIYTGNLSGNRQDGMMLHGRLLQERSEYALGLFNGPRRSFGDTNNDKDFFAFFNVRPFEKSGIKALEVMNFGGEVDYGNEHNPLQPNVFTTANDQSSTGSDAQVISLSPQFFAFNNNVVEDGTRTHHAAWIAWYYKSLNLLVQYDDGYQNYSPGFGKPRTAVQQSGFFVQGYYFVTGEQIKRRVDVTPNRNFSVRNGRITGPGAIELQSRFAEFAMSRNVFDSGLSDPNLWTSHLYAIDTGLNWYPNQYTKIYLDWQHSVFGSPVSNGPGAFHKTADLLWLRFQLFF